MVLSVPVLQHIKVDSLSVLKILYTSYLVQRPVIQQHRNVSECN